MENLAKHSDTRSELIVRISRSRYFEYFFMFLLGALGYGLLEISWRSYTHWTMLIAGGLAFSGIYYFNTSKKIAKTFHRCLCSMLLITIIELCFGVVFNLGFDLNIWDYSGLPLNLWGQISLIYSGLWLVLSYPADIVAGYVHKKWHG